MPRVRGVPGVTCRAQNMAWGQHVARAEAEAASNAHHHLPRVNYLTPPGRASVPLLICIFMKIDK